MRDSLRDPEFDAKVFTAEMDLSEDHDIRVEVGGLLHKLWG